jgi:hypothetical protein
MIPVTLMSWWSDEPLIALGAPKLEGPRGIFSISLYGQSAPGYT